MANGWLCCVCLSLESQAAVLAIVSPYISKDGAASRLFTFPRSYKIYLACLFAAFLAGHTGSIVVIHRHAMSSYYSAPPWQLNLPVERISSYEASILITYRCICESLGTVQRDLTVAKQIRC